MDTTNNKSSSSSSSSSSGSSGSSFAGPWTNEKHLHYLNSMEAAFVRAMLGNKRRLLRLDRYLPDTSDSTLDLMKLNTHPSKKQATTTTTSPPPPSSSVGHETGMDSRAEKRLTRKRRANQHYKSSDDQVVPRIGK